jgi:hypothetical protein
MQTVAEDHGGCATLQLTDNWVHFISREITCPELLAGR